MVFGGGEDPGMKACCLDVWSEPSNCQRTAFDSCWEVCEALLGMHAITLGAACPVVLFQAGKHGWILWVWVPGCVSVGLLTSATELGCLGLNRACVRYSDLGRTAVASRELRNGHLNGAFFFKLFF